MRTALAALLVVLGVAAGVAGAGIAGGHSVNYVSADPQVTPDGTVLVEGAFIETSGWVVVHERTADGYGEALGWTRLPRRNAFYTDVPVTIGERAWRGWNASEVVVVLHGADGDGEFTASDPPLSGFGTVVSDRFVVERGERAVVTGEGDFPQRTGGATVTVRRATLPERGHLVVRNRTADGRVVGVRTLEGGTHENVTVPLNGSFYESTDGSFAARAALHRDDGDGEFGAGDAAIEAGDESVATRFLVEPERSGGAVTTPAATASGTGTTDGTDDTTESSGQGGLGPVVAVVALAALAALGRDPGRRE